MLLDDGVGRALCMSSVHLVVLLGVCPHKKICFVHVGKILDAGAVYISVEGCT